MVCKSCFVQHFTQGSGKGFRIHRFEQGVGVARVCQFVPAGIVLGDGQGLEYGQPGLEGFGLKAAQSVRFCGAIVRVLSHQHERGSFAVAFQRFAHAAGLGAVAAEGGYHVGQRLAVNGAFGHHGNGGRALRFRRGFCSGFVLQRLQAQGKGNGCSLRAAFHIEVPAVGTGQFPCAGERQR